MTLATHLAISTTLLFALGCATTLPAPPARDASHASPPGASASDVPEGAIDPEATTFAYPYPVQVFGLSDQLQRVQMAYMDVAPTAAANGKTVLLLHGKNFSAAAWATSIALLSGQGYRVIAPDQIGFGKSSKPVRYQYSFAGLANNTHELLKSLKIERAIVVGHSMGGMLATRYALNYPSAVERLVLVNPIGLEDYAALVPYRSIDDWYKDELAQTPDTLRAYQQKVYYAGQWSPAYEEHIKLPSGWTKHPDYPRVAWNSALLYSMIMTQPVVGDFPRLQTSSCLIIGTRDTTAPGRSFAPPEVAARMGDYTTLGKRAQAAIPGARLVELEGLGHVPQVEAFDRFREALAGCLQ